jgi:hypothetical protein
MKLKYIILIILFGTLVGCKEEESLKEYLTDSWQTTYLKIEMPTVNKTDSLSVYVDKFDNDPEFIAQSKYNEDGTFTAWFINRENVKSNESVGTWFVKKDSLYIDYVYNGRNIKVAYKITKTDIGFDAESKYDWDEDTDFDDTLWMKTKRIKTD